MTANSQGDCLRTADNTLTWPGAGLGAHERGRIYSGFVFELVKALAPSEGADKAYAIARALTFGAAVLNPTNIQHAVELTLVADDDDNNLANGTPHLAQIRTAAQKKNLWKDEWNPSN